jgi:hypothetical protein
MYRKHPGFVKSVFLGVRASCKALPIYLAWSTLQSFAYISRLSSHSEHSDVKVRKLCFKKYESSAAPFHRRPLRSVYWRR